MTDAVSGHLAVHDVGVSLAGKRILEHISLRLEAGKIIAVVGANGAGKSTLLRVCAGLLTPDAGTVAISGTPIVDISRRSLGRKIAFIPQNRTVHWPLTVERVVALGRLPHRNFAASENSDDIGAIADALRRMDVMHLAQRPIDTLSGGECARVLIARALAQKAAFIVADEPTSGLDLAHALDLFDEFCRLAQQGQGVLVALHDLALAARFADSVFVMKSGRCLAFDRPAEALSTAVLHDAFGVEARITYVDGIPVVVTKKALT